MCKEEEEEEEEEEIYRVHKDVDSDVWHHACLPDCTVTRCWVQ
jgi:hypothetical protein